jgi:hypothetical protein
VPERRIPPASTFIESAQFRQSGEHRQLGSWADCAVDVLEADVKPPTKSPIEI